MTTLRTRSLLLPATALAIGLSACSSSYGSSTATPPPATTTTIAGGTTPARTQAAELRAHMTGLLVEHAYLLAAASGDGSGAAAQLAANSSDVADLLSAPYAAPAPAVGPAASTSGSTTTSTTEPRNPTFRSQFLPLWSARIADIEAYAKAAAAKDTAGTKAASTRLGTDSTALATFMHDNNKYLAVTTVSSPPTGIGDELSTDDGMFTAWADAAATGDTSTVTKLVAAAEAMPHLADVLASATAKLFPTQYPGTPTGTAANLRATLTTMLVEHVVLAINTDGLLAAGQEAGPQSVALADNSTQLHNAFASIYDDNVAAAFSTLWTRMTDGLSPKAPSGGLATFPSDFGAFIAKTTTKPVGDEVTSEMQAQLSAVQQAIAAAGSGSPTVFSLLRTAVAAAQPVASTLAEAVSEQMPARYLP